MPLLPLETYLHPADLLAGPPAATGPGRWWCLQTRPRMEKALARRFLKRGLAFFLPVCRHQWRSRGRLLCSHVPLFPGYLFLHGDHQARLHALETNLLVACLPIEDQALLHADLGRVHRLIQASVPLTPEKRLCPGTVVQITQGPLAGHEGKVLRRGRQVRLVVEVQFLQRGVSVEIDAAVLEPLAACLPPPEIHDPRSVGCPEF